MDALDQIADGSVTVIVVLSLVAIGSIPLLIVRLVLKNLKFSANQYMLYIACVFAGLCGGLVASGSDTAQLAPRFDLFGPAQAVDPFVTLAALQLHEEGK